jgi:hypothetical protein
MTRECEKNIAAAEGRTNAMQEAMVLNISEAAVVAAAIEGGGS